MSKPHQTSTACDLALDSPEFYNALSDVIRCTGTTDFYSSLASLLTRITRCDHHLVMRYTAHGAPIFLVNEALSPEKVRLYLERLYGLDPLYNLAKSCRAPRVVSLRSLGEDETPDDRYMRALFVSLFIFDELAVLLPVPGGMSIAICCDRQREKFTTRDRENIEKILPVVASLHKLHVDRIFALVSPNTEMEVPGRHSAYLVVDDSGRVVRESTGWKALSLPAEVQVDILTKVFARAGGELELSDDYIVRWERLAADFPLAPKGKIVTIELCATDNLHGSIESGIERFRGRWTLTDREVEIVRLILFGYPNSHISRILGIGLGTVRNHRHRLYRKLDITTERELFTMFLGVMLGHDIAAPHLDES